MFRFTIRDVLWLTMVVALAVGWIVNRNQFLLNRQQLLRQMMHVPMTSELKEVERVITLPNPAQYPEAYEPDGRLKQPKWPATDNRP